MKQFDEILTSNNGYIKVVAVIILCVWKDFHFGILKLFEESFHQGIIHLSLTNQNIRTAIILFYVICLL